MWGVTKANKVELQSIRFRRKKFTVVQARKWLKNHKYKPILFEAATGGKSLQDASSVSESLSSDAVVGADKLRDGRSTDEKGTAMPATQPVVTTDLTSDFATLSKTIDKEARRRHYLNEHYLEAKAETPVSPNGYVEGYAVAWDVTDRQGEVMRKGSFAKSLQERVPAGKVLLMIKHFAHGGDFMEAVGKVTEMKENEYGLWFHADFFKDDLSQNVRGKVQEKVVQTTSIGYAPVKYGYINDANSDRRLLEHTECKVFEVTLTAKPANEGAIITGAKTINIDALKQTFTALHTMLPEAKDLAPELKAKALEDLGGKDTAAELSKLVEGLLGKIRAVSEEATDESQSPTPAAGTAGADEGAPGEATAGKADQHSSGSVEEIRQSVEKRKMALRRVQAL